MKVRQSNFELLRIISMFLIMLNHCFEHTVWSNPNNYISNVLINIGKIGNIGVICFMLITGYFQCTNTFKRKSVVTLIIQVIFYSLGFSLIFYFVDIEGINVSLLELGTSVFPVIFKKYWFITFYVIVYLLSPYFNVFIKAMDKKMYQKFLVTLFVILTVISTFFTTTMGVSELAYLIYLYFIGGYLRLHYDKKVDKRKYLSMAIMCVAIYYISVMVFANFAYLSDKIYDNIDYLFELTKLPTLVCSISLFLYFRELNITSKFINVCASCTLGVYLIHDNLFVREFIWNHLFRLDNYYNSKLLLLYGVLVCVVVYIVCTVIELLRKKLIEKRYLKFIK